MNQLAATKKFQQGLSIISPASNVFRQKKKYAVLLILSALCLIANTLYAQARDTYRFRTFSPEGGFYYDGIVDIEQDHDGFVWILMDNNLYRFDGYEYKRYYLYFSNIEQGKKVNFQSIAVDKRGRMFVVVSNKLFMFNKTTNTFSKVYEGNSLSFLKTDKENRLWMKSEGNLGWYDESSGAFSKLFYNGKPLNQTGFFIEDQTGFFFLSWGRNIFRYNYETKQVELFYAFKNDGYIKGICKINNNLWLFTGQNKFYKIDIPTGKVEDEISMLPEDENLYPRMIYADKNEKIWIATQKGIYIFDTKTHHHEHYLHSRTDPFSLPNNSIWVIKEDLQRNIWIGTFSGGVCYVDLNEKVHFKSYIPLANGVNHDLISGFAEDDQRIWIATEGGGLNSIDKTTGNFGYQVNDPRKNSLPSNNVKSIVVDHNQRLWLGTFRGGLSCYTPRQNTFTNYKSTNGGKNSLYSNDLRKLILEPDSGLWIAYQSRKPLISFYSFDKKTFIHHELDQDDNDNYIFDICRGNRDMLWAITHSKLYSINIKTNAVRQIRLSSTNTYGGQTLCVDGNDNVWIGLLGKGLIRYNTKTSTFKVFDEILKFNVFSIYSMCTDNENNIWLGTDNGLFRYNTEKNEFSRFDKKDGVQGQVFYPLAAFRTRNNDLYFGGTNGFTVVSPKNITQNKFEPQVLISDFYVDNTPASPSVKEAGSLQNTTSFPEKIVLNYKQMNFGFTFSSNNYLVPEKNRFRYRLKGYDDRWIEVDASNRNVFYTKVPAGNYIFEVMSANNDGVWNKTPKQIHIDRLPEPWLSWWAYLIYLCCSAAIAYVIYRYYSNQKKLKEQLYLDQMNQEKKEEIHQSQLRFFTNISHDFRTPLSLISAAVDRLRKDGLKEYYYRILNGNTQRLLNLVNELMDFKTVENGTMPLHVSKTNVNLLLEAIAFDFKEYASQHDIRLEIRANPNLPDHLYIDKQVVEKIVMNLLNNAFKYTKNGGSITLQVLASEYDFVPQYENSFTIKDKYLSNNNFAIIVSDTGIGMSEDAIENVFERYYMVKTADLNTHQGTGIGLALVKSLVLLHKGKISIYSKENKGTDCVVCFSSDPDFYDQHELTTEDSTVQTASSGKEQSEEDLIKTPSTEDFIKDKRRLLLAEDHEDLRNMIAGFLSPHFEVIQAENGVAALRLIRKMRIDLIISDIMMPEKDGITFCREVKGDIDTSHIPFILLTAKTSLDSKLEGADSGADLYFEKPLDFKLLLLSIQNIFKQQKQVRNYYSKNYFAESTELTTNQREGDFLRKFIDILDKNLTQPEMDVDMIAYELSMSRSKLYNKIKSLTSKSIIEFIMNYRLRKAARLIVETDLTMREVMEQIGIESQSYFTRAFKKEFGETPTAFATKHKRTNPN